MRKTVGIFSIVLVTNLISCNGQIKQQSDMNYKDDKLESGQIWKYNTRAGEDSSRVAILKVEKYDDEGVVVHIAVKGININNPQKDSRKAEDISHLPFSKEAVIESLTDLESSNNDLPDFENGYQQWKQAFNTGKGGIFTIEIKDAVEYVEQTMNQ